MSKQKNHDLYDFMLQISAEMSAEYKRIQMRATEDPGTAGDQGEENWAEVLREWLPRTYEVVTKGRIISQEGVTSPQIDVLVLKGAYPKKLLNKKLYLSAGVAAAFECKTTLKASHILEAVENCIKIKSLYPNRTLIRGKAGARHPSKTLSKSCTSLMNLMYRILVSNLIFFVLLISQHGPRRR
jgi:hypothetical protein